MLAVGRPATQCSGAEPVSTPAKLPVPPTIPLVQRPQEMPLLPSITAAEVLDRLPPKATSAPVPSCSIVTPVAAATLASCAAAQAPVNLPTGTATGGITTWMGLTGSSNRSVVGCGKRTGGSSVFIGAASALSTWAPSPLFRGRVPASFSTEIAPSAQNTSIEFV